ncbi:hypothetical protein ACLOJK_039106 [Asimina triloba]
MMETERCCCRIVIWIAGHCCKECRCRHWRRWRLGLPWLEMDGGADAARSATSRYCDVDRCRLHASWMPIWRGRRYWVLLPIWGFTVDRDLLLLASAITVIWGSYEDTVDFMPMLLP